MYIATYVSPFQTARDFSFPRVMLWFSRILNIRAHTHTHRHTHTHFIFNAYIFISSSTNPFVTSDPYKGRIRAKICRNERDNITLTFSFYGFLPNCWRFDRNNFLSILSCRRCFFFYIDNFSYFTHTFR